MKPFKLTPSISFSETEFKKLLTKEKWDELFKRVYDKSSETCCGCGYSNGNKKSLYMHLHWWDEKNTDTAEFILLCEGCHIIKHFDIAIQKDCVLLVNSILSQEELTRRNRSLTTIKKHIQEKKIVILKKTPAQYFAEIQESEQNRSEKTKILFKSTFPWINK